MKCCVMQHFIWGFTVCQSTRFGVSGLKRVMKGLTVFLTKKCSLLQLAHHEEKLMLMEQSLQTTQEQLSQRVTEVVRHEQVNRKLETELKTLRDRNLNSEEEIDEQKSVIDKLRKELMRVKEEHHAAVQEGLAYKQQAHKSEVELDGAKEQEKMLTEQVCTLNILKVVGV